MSERDGGPAFPCTIWSDGGIFQAGMSLRDWFAGKALQGMIESAPICDRTKISRQKWAKAAYQWADAMLKERNKP